MLYSLDTNCVSQILNGQQTTLNHLRNALLAGDDVILNAVCYYEIKRGLVLPTFQRKLQVFEQLVRRHGLLDLDKTALDERYLSGFAAKRYTPGRCRLAHGRDCQSQWCDARDTQHATLSENHRALA
jgi:hypothetical protein